MNFLEIEEHLKKIALNMPKIVPQLLELSYNETQFHVKDARFFAKRFYRGKWKGKV